MDFTPTPSQTVGPYLHLGLTDEQSIPRLAGDGVKGERLWLRLHLLDGDGVPVPDAMIELWQADSEGNYPCSNNLDVQGSKNRAIFRGFGRLPTAEDGSCCFETIKPGSVLEPEGSRQAPHINVSILGRGLLKRLSTRVYFAGEPMNANDPVLAWVPENRRNTLMAQPDPSRANGWVFPTRLCGEDETVFFDV